MSSHTTRPLLVSTNNHSSLISIVAWVLIVTTAFSVFIRLSTRFALTRKFGADDVFIIIALIFSIATSLLISIEAIDGLGRPISSLNQQQVQLFQQLRYATGFLYAASLCCTKMSVVVLLRSLSPKTLHRRLSLVMGSLVFSWTVISILVIALQCQIPKAWEIIGNRCISTTAFWSCFEAINITTDFALILLPLGMIWGLQTKKSRKAIFFGCFAVRFLVVIAATIRIIYLIRESNPGDVTLETWPATLYALIVESLSVIAACIPYLKPFLDSLESGMMNNDQLRREGMSDLYGRGRSKGTGSHQPKRASYDVLGSNKTEYPRRGLFSHSNDEDCGIFCGSNLPSPSVATAREATRSA